MRTILICAPIAPGCWPGPLMRAVSRKHGLIDSSFHYLFRIATNLVHDSRRRPRMEQPDGDSGEAVEHADPLSADAAGGAIRRIDLARSMARLKPREREMLWLAYAQGSSHEEIAESLGLRKSSIKILLFRARRRLAVALGARS